MINKDEIIKIIDNFYKEYNLPPQDISDKEWNSLLTVLEAHFMAHNIMDDYIHAINIIIRRALNLAMIDDEKCFNINHLLRALCDLSAFNIFHDEIIAMREEITDRIEEKSHKR